MYVLNFNKIERKREILENYSLEIFILDFYISTVIYAIQNLVNNTSCKIFFEGKVIAYV